MSELTVCAKTTLDPDALKSFKVTRVFKDRFGLVNGMDWDKEGKTLVVSSNDESIQIFPLGKSDVSKILFSKKYGVEMVKFAHQGAKQVLCSSRTTNDKDNHAVRLWDLIENKYVRNFSTPSPLIKFTGLTVHPFRNLMLITCQDHTSRLFSFDSEAPFDTYTSESPNAYPVGAFDRDDLVFAIYNGVGGIKLYDIHNYSQPFNTLNIKRLLKTDEYLQSMSFCPSGKRIVCSTNLCRIIAIDAFTGEGLFNCSYGDKSHRDKLKCIPTITPDGNYVLCGGSDSSIHGWNMSGKKILELKGHEGPPSLLAFNPKRALLASGCVNVAWWQPELFLQ